MEIHCWQKSYYFREHTRMRGLLLSNRSRLLIISLFLFLPRFEFWLGSATDSSVRKHNCWLWYVQFEYFVSFNISTRAKPGKRFRCYGFDKRSINEAKMDNLKRDKDREQGSILLKTERGRKTVWMNVRRSSRLSGL